MDAFGKACGMTQTFKVGEVAILQNCGPLHAHLNGTECEITALESGVIFGEPYSYVVMTADGEKYAKPHQLRKKRPPQSTDEWAAERVKQVTKPVAQPVREVA